MGNQITALAAGAKSYKLPMGNRGHNQPVRNLLNDPKVSTPCLSIVTMAPMRAFFTSPVQLSLHSFTLRLTVVQLTLW